MTCSSTPAVWPVHGWPAKDPDEVLDYLLDWTARLGADDKLLTAAWFIAYPEDDAALIIGDESFNAKSVLIWLSGGTIGVKYVLTNRVTTEQGRTMDTSVSITIKEK